MRFFETNPFEGDHIYNKEASWAGNAYFTVHKIKTGDWPKVQSPVAVMTAFYSAQNTKVNIWLPSPKSRTKIAERPSADSRTFVPQFS